MSEPFNGLPNWPTWHLHATISTTEASLAEATEAALAGRLRDHIYNAVLVNQDPLPSAMLEWTLEQVDWDRLSDAIVESGA